ncbi:MAG: sulfotransferase family protein [Candidatus Thorarchaeota archaeon]
MKVIICGMHRSGTSMVAGLLRLCGLYLGDNLLNGLRDNARGHFEDREFLGLNIEILRANKTSWRQCKPVIKVPKAMIEKMAQFVAKWPTDGAVGWKDPRACLTLKFWKQVIEPEELRVVLVFRPFIEVAMSLKKRNKFTIQKCRELYNFYCSEAEKGIKDLPHIRTHYHNYFSDWHSELGKVCSFLGLKIPDNTELIERFIDASLWHHRERIE